MPRAELKSSEQDESPPASPKSDHCLRQGSHDQARKVLSGSDQCGWWQDLYIWELSPWSLWTWCVLRVVRMLLC